MKKIRTFMLIFLSLSLLVFIVNVASTERVNAKKSVRQMLKAFTNDGKTEVKVLYYEQGKLIKETPIKDNKAFLRTLSRSIYNNVIKKTEEAELMNDLRNFVRVELQNKESKYLIDFFNDNEKHTRMTIADAIYGKSSLFILSKKDSNIMASWSEK